MVLGDKEGRVENENGEEKDEGTAMRPYSRWN